VKLAAWIFLPIGAAIAVVVGLTLVFGGFRARRALERFGDGERMRMLRTSDPAKRRGYKGVLLVAAILCAFFAAARPQYGKGTRLIPATNLDVVLVLDFSKSMYARDVAPNRIKRAQLEVEGLVTALRGARFGAVAFAGEPISFPLSADGSAIAQFLRSNSPNDMPVGGTAIGRALAAARLLLDRDPKSKSHKRVIVLITDGEDLEGNPVKVAENIAASGTTIHVVQIGRKTAEAIPEMSEDGRLVGWRTTANGKPLTTALTAAGEQQLQAISETAPDGKLIRAKKGSTGITELTEQLKRQMKGELSERVEHVYADVYFYPLAVALFLLLLEVFLSEAPRRVFVRKQPPPPAPRFRKLKSGGLRRAS
jgi:Ca-activated chloride channel family protein